MVAAGVAAVVIAPGIAEKFGDAFARALHADPATSIGGVGSSSPSFAGYIALSGTSRTARPRDGLRASGEIALAEHRRDAPASHRRRRWCRADLLEPPSRRPGQPHRHRTLLSFLVVLYSIFLGWSSSPGPTRHGRRRGRRPFELTAIPRRPPRSGSLPLLFALRHDRRRLAGRPASGRAMRSGARSATPSRSSAGRMRGCSARSPGGASTCSSSGRRSTPSARRPRPRCWCSATSSARCQHRPAAGRGQRWHGGRVPALGMPAEVVLPPVLAYRAIPRSGLVPAGAAASRDCAAGCASERSRMAAPRTSRGGRRSHPAPTRCGPGALAVFRRASSLAPSRTRPFRPRR